MAERKASLSMLGLSWVLTIEVALVAIAFNKKRDTSDFVAIAALVALSGQLTYKYLKENKQGK
jgi:hypothetical protein